MGFDYYAILNVPRNASLHDIKLSYRRLALKLHPHRKRYPQHPNPAPEGTFTLPTLPENTYWELINEAYDVLSNPLWREVFDNYGEEGLKKGVSAPEGRIQPYCYHKEPLRTYFTFFGSYSPYADLIDAIVNPPLLYKVEEGVGVKNKDPTLHRLIYLDLEEVFHGGVKKVKIMRQQFVDDFKTKTEEAEVELSVNIEPGILEGTELVFLESGDQSPTRIPADIAFHICDKPHKIFRRENWNLHMNWEISLQEALTGFKITVNTIDDRKLPFLITDIVE